MRNSETYRKLAASEIAALEAQGNVADSWSTVEVADGFNTGDVWRCRLSGIVRIGRGVRLADSRISNYEICEGATVENVTALECRHESSFGNGVRVATMNECEGRSIGIFDGLTSQIAYIAAVYRYRPQTTARIESMVDEYAAARRSAVGRVGRGARISGTRFIRETAVGDNAVIEGASALQNATVGCDTYIGVDVKAYDFITGQGAHIDNGVILERCFVGDAVIMDKAFTAADSLFFACSHFENGEAAAIFAGPFTVSHHKSSLLIAGMFSFFNAGSGSNQSNHLFKSGAVHQSVHLRGCKFASGAYIMSPAIEGPFTMVMGHHSRHHDTTDLPYSYLIEKEGRSMLIPGANLMSYGTVRDIEKWAKRDRRKVKNDIVDFDEYNPYIAGKLIRGLNVMNSLQDENPDTELYGYNKVLIKAPMLQRGIRLYNRAIGASIGKMLGDERIGACGEAPKADVRGDWVDLGGQYVSKAYLKWVLDGVDDGSVATLEALDARLRSFDDYYADYAREWALGVLGDLLGHEPDEQEIADAVAAADNLHEAMRRTTDEDRDNDCSPEMSVGYGVDCDTPEERMLDYRTVRGL